MSINIEPTTFTNNRDGKITYGFRIYDDYSQHYCNTMEKIPDDDLDFLKDAMDCSEGDKNIEAMFDFIREQEAGINIGGQYYDFDEVKECF